MKAPCRFYKQVHDLRGLGKKVRCRRYIDKLRQAIPCRTRAAWPSPRLTERLCAFEPHLPDMPEAAPWLLACPSAAAVSDPIPPVAAIAVVKSKHACDVTTSLHVQKYLQIVVCHTFAAARMYSAVERRHHVFTLLMAR